MNKSEAIAHMISKVEEIERERLAAHFSILLLRNLSTHRRRFASMLP